MELFGMPIEQVYFYTLIIMGATMILYLFFGDAVEGIGEGIPFITPTIIFSFLTFASASGFIFEKITDLSSLLSLVFSCAIAIILSVLLYFFVLLPLKSAEVSLAYTEESLAGQLGKVIVPIPSDGFGEVVIETVNGVISKRATGYDNEAIAYEKQVLIVDVKEGTLFVKEYVPILSQIKKGGV